MIKSIFNNYGSRKFKYFLIFLLISSLVWFFGRLSEEYQSEIQLKVNYVKVPNNLFSAINNPNTIGVRVKAKGFALMRSHLNNYKIELSMDRLDANQGIYHMSTEVLINQIKSQLPSHLEFLSVNNEDVNISLFELRSKKVPVTAVLDLKLPSSYLVDQFKVSPDSVVISGSEDELQKYCSIYTEYKTIPKATSDIVQQLDLVVPEDAFNLKLSHSSVTVEVDVERYMDRYFDLDIEQINTNDSIHLKTFPSRVSVLAYALVKDLKDISVDDFKVYVDALEAYENSSELLEVHLESKNSKVLSSFLMNKQVEYILR